MADLPEKRSSDAAFFTYVCVDMIGPFIAKEGKKEFKRYGAIFTSLASWDMYLEVVYSMDKNNFVMCLRRFIGGRGNVRS